MPVTKSKKKAIGFVLDAFVAKVDRLWALLNRYRDRCIHLGRRLNESVLALKAGRVTPRIRLEVRLDRF